MSFEIRAPRPEEAPRIVELISWAFGGQMHEPPDPFLELFEPERLVVAVDDGAVVGGSGALTFRMSVPGGADAGCAGVTLVSVLPSHRRRGILTAMMRQLLDGARARGEPLAALFASEGAIYGRYGFGRAVEDRRIDAQQATFRDPPHPGARVRLLPLDEALERLPPLYEAERPRRAGLLARDDAWWRGHRLFDPEWRRRGGGPMFRGLLELDGEPCGYVLYRLRRGETWTDGLRLDVLELLARSADAARELWRFVFSVDLVERVRAFALAADDPLPLLVTEPSRLGLAIDEGLWLRVVDVRAALEARALGPGTLVLELDDPFCPWNAGRWRVTAGRCERSDAEPELALGAEELGSVYLGGWSVRQLLDAGRVREITAGAAARADELLRVARAPFSPEVF